MEYSDQQILTKFKSGDNEAISALFNQYYRVLCVYAFKFLDDLFVAEDIVQDIIVHFWEARKYDDIEGSLKGYLFASVRNRSINYLSSKKVVNTEYLKNLEKQFFFEQFTDDELDEQKAKLYREIAKLPPQGQRVLRLIVFEGKKYKEVSESLGISVNTVKTHFSNSLRALRSVMDILILMMSP